MRDLWREVYHSRTALHVRLLNQVRLALWGCYTVSGHLGFYGSTPICIQNLFTSEPNLVVLKIVYVLVVLAVLLLVMACYVTIVTVTKKRAVEANVVPTAADKERSQFLSFKVTLVILTQMLAWFPIRALLFSRVFEADFTGP